MKKLICVLTVLSLILIGCDKSENTTEDSITSIGDSLNVQGNLGEFKYHVIVDEDGNEVTVLETESNIEDVNQEVSNAGDSANSNDNNGASKLKLPDKQEEEALISSIVEQEQKDIIHDNRLDELDFKNANEGEDYDVFYGDKIAQSGTVVEQALFTSMGTPVNATIKFNSVDAKQNLLSVSFEITYDYNELLSSIVDYYADEEEAKRSLLQESFNAVLYLSTNNFSSSSESLNLTISDTGIVTGSLSVQNSSNEEINSVSLSIGTTNIRLL